VNNKLLRLGINLWPPYLFAGIHATHISADYRSVDVELRERWYNRNYVGTHFGGSLFAMTDAWYMIMLLHNLGKDTLRAQFRLDEAILQRIREHTADGEKYLPEFEVVIVNAENKLIARVIRTLYVRKKKTSR
jgi:acyl-coenzyme A thioesterase PaaI-like protein